MPGPPLSPLALPGPPGPMHKMLLHRGAGEGQLLWLLLWLQIWLPA